MKTYIKQPNFTGYYYSLDEMDKLKKYLIHQGPIILPNLAESVKDKYFYVICFKNKNKFWQQVIPMFTPDQIADTPKKARERLEQTINVNKKTVRNEKGRRIKIEMFMARKKVPIEYKDVLNMYYENTPPPHKIR